jgi:hypothetical protein
MDQYFGVLIIHSFVRHPASFVNSLEVSIHTNKIERLSVIAIFEEIIQLFVFCTHEMLRICAQYVAVK